MSAFQANDESSILSARTRYYQEAFELLFILLVVANRLV